MTDRTSVVADFWLAVARNNHDEAQNAMCRLDVPIVSISLAYSFEMVDGEERLAEVEQEDTGALVGPVRGVMPDTPTSTVVAWNAEVGVLLVVVSKLETCMARLGDGEVDFLACAGPLERPGGTSCGWATHELGGKDSKKRSVIKMDLPEIGSVFAIQVKPSGSSVVRPKVFSLPIYARINSPTRSRLTGAYPSPPSCLRQETGGLLSRGTRGRVVCCLMDWIFLQFSSGGSPPSPRDPFPKDGGEWLPS